MKSILELIIEPKPNKRKEFGQTMEDLNMKFKNYCSSFTMDESADRSTVIITNKWETAEKMNETLNSDEFKILSGAIEALCEKIEIRLNDEIVGNQISMLNSMRIKTDKMNSII